MVKEKIGKTANIGQQAKVFAPIRDSKIFWVDFVQQILSSDEDSQKSWKLESPAKLK